jgi:hypothetical protein
MTSFRVFMSRFVRSSPNWLLTQAELIPRFFAACACVRPRHSSRRIARWVAVVVRPVSLPWVGLSQGSARSQNRSKTAVGGALRYFHGGVPGLRPGDTITPHAPNVIDGCPICAARAKGQTATLDGQAVDPPTGRPDMVYITTDRDYGRFYASRYWYGDLYTVEPVGEMEPSTEDPFPTWCVPAARVVAVYTRAVQLTPGQRRSVLRRWTEADRAASR